MTMELSAIGTSGIQTGLTGTTKSATGMVDEVGKTFQEMLNSLSETENTSDTLMQQFSAGGDVDLHELMIAMEQTDVNFKVAMNIQGKLVSAYQEIMRMQV
jgi:flagellar hook-basal body complex protein FliE